jgi:hypothetical protein
MEKLALPYNVGKAVVVERDDGAKHYFMVVDEIVRRKTDAPNTALCFQRLQHKKENTVLFRFCYYFSDGQEWVFVKDTSYVPAEDFRAIVRKAIQKGWIEPQDAE